MKYSCTIHGIGIQYNTPIAALEGLPPAERIDAKWNLGHMLADLQAPVIQHAVCHYTSPQLDEEGRPGLRIWRTQDSAYYRADYSDGTRFAVTASGEEMWATWPDSASIEDTAPYLLGPGLGFLMRLRGVTCLHASAVVLGDVAIGLMGPAGAGKSTTAAAFARMGHAVLSDDTIAIFDRSGRFEAHPSFPGVRLWPDSVASLFGSEDHLPRLAASWDKRFLALGSSGPYRFHDRALPLGAVYVLDERSDAGPSVTAMTPRESLIELVANSSPGYVLDDRLRTREFDLLSRLANSIPCRRISASTDFSSLRQLCEIIAEDVQQRAGKSP